MRKLILTVVFCFVLVTFNQRQNFLFSSEQEDFPDIQFEERVYNFGVAGQQEKVAHNYRFINAGKGVLIIKAVKPSCGCVAALLSSKEIPPGVSAVVEASFNTGKYEGKETKTIYVYSNDPDKPEIALEIAGEIKTEVAVKPDFLYFGDVEKGRAITKTISLIQIGEKQLSLNRVEVAEEYFVTRTSNFEDGHQKGFKIDITLKPNAPIGRFTEVMTLHTNLSRHPRIDIPICGDVLGRIRVKPQMLSLGTLTKGSSPADKIEIIPIGRKQFHITKVTSDPSFLSTVVSPAKDNGQVEIAVKVDKNAPLGKLVGNVNIYTDDIGQPLIRVPVYGLIAQSHVGGAVINERSSEAAESKMGLQ